VRVARRGGAERLDVVQQVHGRAVVLGGHAAPAEGAAGLVVVPGQDVAAAAHAEGRGDHEGGGGLVGAALEVHHRDVPRAVQGTTDPLQALDLQTLLLPGPGGDHPAGGARDDAAEPAGGLHLPVLRGRGLQVLQGGAPVGGHRRARRQRPLRRGGRRRGGRRRGGDPGGGRRRGGRRRRRRGDGRGRGRGGDGRGRGRCGAGRAGRRRGGRR